MTCGDLWCRADVTERYDNVFWFGDLNFRLHQSRPRVIDTIVESSSSVLLRERTMSDACLRSLLEWDQLNHAKHKGTRRLRSPPVPGRRGEGWGGTVCS